MNDDYALCMVCCTTQENAKQRQSTYTSNVLSSSTIDLTVDKSDSSRSKSNTGSVNSVSKSKLEKVPRGIRGEKSSKDMASSRNLGTDSVYVNSADKPAVKTKVPSCQPAAEGKVQTNIKKWDVRTREKNSKHL